MREKRILEALGQISDEYILEAASPRAKGRAFPKRKTAVLLAAALILLLATTAFAGGLGWHEKFIELFRPSGEHIAELEGATDMPEATVSHDGITVSVKQSLADAFGVYVLYEMSVLEDIVLDDGIGWAFEGLFAPHRKVEGSAIAALGGSEILEQSGSKRTVLIYETGNTTAIENGKLELFLMDLCPMDSSGMYGGEPLVEGQWGLEWDFEYKDPGKWVRDDIPLGGDIINELYISPISFCIRIVYDEKAPRVSPVVKFSDGSEIVIDPMSGKVDLTGFLSNEPTGEYTYQYFYRFDELIELENVVSVQVGEVTIPIE